MMESKVTNQNELLEQLKQLQAEKASLEKHVFMLNECLSIEELKQKIAHLEKKKEMIGSLENLIEKLRDQIEPLNYLKKTLETKLSFENQMKQSQLKSFIKSNSSNSKIDNDQIKIDFFNTLPIPKTSQSQSTQNIYPDITKYNKTSTQKLYDNLIDLAQTPSSTNSMSIVNDECLDEATQLLEQYDVVTDQEILNFSEHQKSKTQDINQEPTASTSTADVANKIPEEDASLTNSCSDAKNIDVQMQNSESLSTKEKVDMESSINNLIKNDLKNADDFVSHLQEVIKNELYQLTSGSVSSNTHVNINNLMMKLPTFLLEKKNDSIKVVKELISSLENDLLTVTNDPLKENIIPNKTIPKKDELNTLQSQAINNESIEQINSRNLNESPNMTNSNKNINNFNDMNLKIDILRGIYSLGFVNPTSLQQRVIVQCINGRDVIVFAGPGNGRTLMFTIPLLQRLRTNLNECQALILVPTRDLAVHIQKIIMSVGDFLGVNVCIGGDNVPKKLSVVPHVVVGTPKGVSNMIECKSLNTRCIQTVVINKVDKMMTLEYSKLIETIMTKLEKNKQVTVLTSDKLEHVLDLYMEILRDPMVIIQENYQEKENLKSLPKQFYLSIQEDWKVNALCEIHETLKTQRVIIFCNTLDRAQKLCESLRLEYPVALFHLDKNAREREIILEMFSSNTIRMLVTTDPIKGNQFQHASWIINYDLPINPVGYLDRISKCAENIKVLNFINENDDQTKSVIETHNNSYMIQMPLNIIDLLEY